MTNLRSECACVDASQGDIRSFRGREWIRQNGPELYEFVYQCGLIRE